MPTDKRAAGFVAAVLFGLCGAPHAADAQAQQADPAAPVASERRSDADAGDTASHRETDNSSPREETFVPSETVSSDSAVSFPVDI